MDHRLSAGRDQEDRHLPADEIAAYGSIRSVSDARALTRLEFGRIARAEDPPALRLETRRREKFRLDVTLTEYEQGLVRRKYVNWKAVLRTLRTRLTSYAAIDVSKSPAPI